MYDLDLMWKQSITCNEKVLIPWFLMSRMLIIYVREQLHHYIIIVYIMLKCCKHQGSPGKLLKRVLGEGVTGKDWYNLQLPVPEVNYYEV